MPRLIIKKTRSGKCDVTITLYDKDNGIVFQNSSTFDVKPTIKELIRKYKDYKKAGATTIKIMTTPSFQFKTYPL